MQGNRGPTGNPQARGNANQREDRADEGLVGQATEAVRNVAEARPTWRGTPMTRVRVTLVKGGTACPDVDRYGRAVSRPVEQNPLVAILAAGAVGYLLAYVIQGSRSRAAAGRGTGGECQTTLEREAPPSLRTTE